MEIIHTLIYQPIFNLLFVLYNIVGGNLGYAIVLLAVIVKIAMVPMMNSQRKMAVKQKQIAAKLNELKLKYKDDPQTLVKEQMKVQGGLTAGLGGCLMMIITIVLFLQIRSTILDLTDRGWHAFNSVAYVESWKQPEDSLIFEIPQISSGMHSLKLNINATDVNYTQTIDFWIYSNQEEKEKYSKESREKIGKNSSSTGQHNDSYGATKISSSTGNYIASVYSPQFKDNFLIKNDSKSIELYFRFPVNSSFKSVDLTIDENPITTFVLTHGTPVDLNFFGIDLGRTAVDVVPNSNIISNLLHPAVIPYLLLALFLGLSQYFSFKYLSPSRSTDIQEAENIIEGEVISETAELQTTKDEKKKQRLVKDIKDKKENEKDRAVDMAKTMEDMSSSMGWMFASLSVITSLGILGGSQFFPAGLSIYWTSQSLFDIIKGIYSEKMPSYTKLFRKK